ncbi:hypothetical protein [Salinadaptatus halalkaliphilus]|uniref:hypothetical protein n=1 Tax=Salinadaptatus halalkaliphilus TaxID=2419781 RepID=UPI0015801C1F|nr:hypothetical protein [Salinadaptatus halalkaliphilus]
MFRAILPEGQIACQRYEHAENGLELYDEDDEFVAFVPYATLNALVSEKAYTGDERSIM